MKNTQKIYDYVILGGGIGGLSIGALLSTRGHSVCLVEGNKVVGGYAHTLKKGKYSFCHEVQYLMGCGKYGVVTRFLALIGLADLVKFNELDRTAFDIIAVDGQKRISVPHNLYIFERDLTRVYPQSASALHQYFKIIGDIFRQATMGAHYVVTTTDLLLHPWRYRTLLRYRNYTLHDLFEKLHMPTHLCAILAGQAGNLSAGPKKASLLMHAAMQVAYCESAHFPKKGMEFFINSIAGKITQNPENRILTNCRIKKIIHHGNTVDHIVTSKGIIRGNHFISNLDPHKTVQMMGHAEIPSSFRHKTNYDYSQSVFTLYIGLKNIDIRKYGFGRRNIWHHSSVDIDGEFSHEYKNDDFSRPWLFISTPSMNTDKGVLCPTGSHTMEILTFVNEGHFRRLYETNRPAFNRLKKNLTNRMLDILSAQYLPDIRKYIDELVVHTPLDVERILHSPHGNVYGMSLTPKHYNIQRITFRTPFTNLNFVGATSSYPGIMGVIRGSLDLFSYLARKNSPSFYTTVFIRIQNVFIDIYKIIRHGKAHMN